MERRRFLARLSAALGALIAAFLAVPGLAVLADPLRRRTSERGFVRLAALGDLSEGRPVRRAVRQTVVDAWTRYAERPVGSVWLVRRDDDRVEAFSSKCPHAGCNVDLHEDGERFVCACHDALFTDSGEQIAGPSKRGMDPLEVRVADGFVEVRWQRFKLGIAERIPS